MGGGSAKTGDVEMMPFVCPYAPAEVVSRARSWVGRPISRAEWRPGETCLHLAAYAYGWDGNIPSGWQGKTLADLMTATGWRLTDKAPCAGALGAFRIHGHDHLGIFTDGGFLIHAGVLTIVEALADRYLPYFKGVMECP